MKTQKEVEIENSPAHVQVCDNPQHPHWKEPHLRHTPTPWSPEIINNWPIEQEKANQEFMLRAVNAHEELLAACKVALNSLDLDIQAMGQLERAIANAERGHV